MKTNTATNLIITAILLAAGIFWLCPSESLAGKAPAYDVYQDGEIDIKDMVLIAIHFGERKGHRDWDDRADVNGDGEVDILDLTQVGKHFGEKVESPGLSLEDLIKIAEDPDSDLNRRKAAIGLLRQISDPRVIPQLITWLEDSNINMLLTARDALIVIGEPAVPQLFSAYIVEGNAMARTALSMMSASIPFLIGQLRNQDPNRVKAAVEILGLMGNNLAHTNNQEYFDKADEIANALVSLLREEDDATARNRLVTALGQTGAPAVAPLMEMVLDERVHIFYRGNGVNALGLIGEPAVDGLIQLLENRDLDRAVRLRIGNALESTNDPRGIGPLINNIDLQELWPADGLIKPLGGLLAIHKDHPLYDTGIAKLEEVALHSEFYQHRAKAVRALSDTKDPRIVSIIVHVVLTDDNEEVRRMASGFLDDLGEGEIAIAVEGLILDLDNTDPARSQEAEILLVTLLGDSEIAVLFDQGKLTMDRHQDLRMRLQEREALRSNILTDYGVTVDDRFVMGAIEGILFIVRGFPGQLVRSLNIIYDSTIDSGAARSTGSGIKFKSNRTIDPRNLFHEIIHDIDRKFLGFSAIEDLHGRTAHPAAFVSGYASKSRSEDLGETGEFYGMDTAGQFLTAIEGIRNAKDAFEKEAVEIRLKKLLFIVDLFTDQIVDGRPTGETTRVYLDFNHREVPVSRDAQDNLVAIEEVNIYNPDGTFNLDGLQEYFAR